MDLHGLQFHSNHFPEEFTNALRAKFLAFAHANGVTTWAVRISPTFHLSCEAIRIESFSPDMTRRVHFEILEQELAKPFTKFLENHLAEWRERIDK